MDNPIQVSHNKTRRTFLIVLTLLVLTSVACGMFGIDFDRIYNNDPDYQITLVTDEIVKIQTYYGKGIADTTFIYSNMPGNVKSNKCHDETTEAILKVFPGHSVPDNSGFSRQLTSDEYYFSAEIHAALQRGWQNKQCVFADTVNDYVLTQINGIYDHKTGVFHPLYNSVSASGCDNNSSVFESYGRSVSLKYHCIRDKFYTLDYSITMDAQ